MEISKRKFVKYALLGIGAAGLGAGVMYRLLQETAPAPAANPEVVIRSLAITEALVEMGDRRDVYHWAFEDLDNPAHLPQMPGPLIEAVEGDTINLTLTNNLPDAHGFAVPGMPFAGVEIAPGETKVLSFPAPGAGSYMYLDPLNAPVNRVLGLHGPMVVLPSSGDTPYSNPAPNIRKLFNDLGKAAHFPGESWAPVRRTKIWLFNSIDPKFNEMAQRGEAIDADRFREGFLPRYFTINGEAGSHASHSLKPETIPSSFIGEPNLIRIMNAGMATHSPHIHANHVYVLSVTEDNVNNMIQANPFFVDTFTVRPLDRVDWLLPFHRPPDIPDRPGVPKDKPTPLRELIPQELNLVLKSPQSPLGYPMHGHTEQDQSMAGGNYPGGLVLHWEIIGDVDKVKFPNVR